MELTSCHRPQVKSRKWRFWGVWSRDLRLFPSGRVPCIFVAWARQVLNVHKRGYPTLVKGDLPIENGRQSSHSFRVATAGLCQEWSCCDQTEILRIHRKRKPMAAIMKYQPSFFMVFIDSSLPRFPTKYSTR